MVCSAGHTEVMLEKKKGEDDWGELAMLTCRSFTFLGLVFSKFTCGDGWRPELGSSKGLASTERGGVSFTASQELLRHGPVARVAVLQTWPSAKCVQQHQVQSNNPFPVSIGHLDPS